jgi:hypothetical protein
MKQGILIFAQNNATDNYVKQAYLCAMSGIHSGNKHFTLVTDNEVDEKTQLIFDKVIILEDDQAVDSEWKIENRWKAFELSPYQETIVVDSDVLFLEKVDWEKFDGQELYFTQNPITYRQEPINDTYYRKVFHQNALFNIYTGLYYFKKTKRTAQFFKLLQTVIEDWQEFYKVFCTEFKPKHCSIDVCAAIVLELMEYDNFQEVDAIDFVHMKLHAQNWVDTNERWQEKVDWYFNTGLKVGNHQQHGVFHYTEKDFCDNILARYEECIG